VLKSPRFVLQLAFVSMAMFHATADAMLEVSCHENDYDMENYLRGARSEERSALDPRDK
jgi:hypothetical protein